MLAPLVHLGLLSLISSAVAAPARELKRDNNDNINTQLILTTVTEYSTVWIEDPARADPTAPPAEFTMPLMAPEPTPTGTAANIEVIAESSPAPAPAPAAETAPAVVPTPAANQPVPEVAPAVLVQAPAPQVEAPAATQAPVQQPAPAPEVTIATAPAPVAAEVPPATAPAPAPATEQAPAPAPAPVQVSPPVSRGKAGVAYNNPTDVAPFMGGKNIGWAYNWGATPNGIPSGIEYVPMLWSSNKIGDWLNEANTAINNGATAVLGFNEPDHAEQANVDYGQAAAVYKQQITDHFAGRVKLVSPAVTNGGAPMGLAYLKNFMNACTDCGIQAIAIHWYDSSSNVEYFKSHVQSAYDQFKMPIWLTEFGTIDGNDEAFLAAVLPWLDAQPYVERYAYFFSSGGKLQLLQGSQLSPAARTYAST